MNAFAGLYNRRIRGFRVINFAAVVFLIALMFGLYWAKTRASVDGTAIGRIESQIGVQKRDIRMLEARVAGLERQRHLEPARPRPLHGHARERPDVLVRAVIVVVEDRVLDHHLDVGQVLRRVP